MDADRTLWGGIGALVGAVGGYLACWLRGRRGRRELALLRKLTRRNSQQQTEALAQRLNGLKREEIP